AAAPPAAPSPGAPSPAEPSIAVPSPDAPSPAHDALRRPPPSTEAMDRAQVQAYRRLQQAETFRVRELQLRISGGAAGGGLGRGDGLLEPDGTPWPPKGAPRPLGGPLADIERRLATGEVAAALAAARGWHDKQPGDVLALIGLGDALEASHALGE